MLLITNGTIVDPVQGIYKGDILIRDGKIAKIADKIEQTELKEETESLRIIDAAGKKIGVICISLTGVRIKLAEDRMSLGQELLLNLSGPAVNLLFGGIMLTEKTMQSMRAAAVHWAVAVATLLPLGNSDGTVIVDILLECCCGKLTGRTRRWLRRGIGVAALAGLLVLGGAFG